MGKEKYKDSSLPVEERIKDLVSRMTLQEKAAQLDEIAENSFVDKCHPATGDAIADDANVLVEEFKKKIGTVGVGAIHSNYAAPRITNEFQRIVIENTRLSIPMVVFGEALHGICRPDATLFPIPMALAATFDRELVNEIGKAIATEARALGINEIYGPNLDLAREPRWGRTEETFGEDTYLAASMGREIIKGLQQGDISKSTAVAAEPKHFVGYGVPERGINCGPAHIGKRELETDYLPVFEAGIKDAGAYNAMASYNSIDGIAVAGSHYYLTEILRDRYNMRGFVRADFGAIAKLLKRHRVAEDEKGAICKALNAGLDMQGYDFDNEFWQTTICQLVEEGKITVSHLDEMVSRVLRVKFDLGLFENPYVDENNYKAVVHSEKHRELSRRASEESVCLLKNKAGFLPLDKDGIKSVAVIGPLADNQQIGGYSPIQYNNKVNSVLKEIKALCGDKVTVSYVKGCGIMDEETVLIKPEWLKNVDGEQGVTVEYYEGLGFDTRLITVKNEPQLDFNWALLKPIPEVSFTGYSVKIKGSFAIDIDGFKKGEIVDGSFLNKVSDSVRFMIEDSVVIDNWGEEKRWIRSVHYPLVNGKRYSFELQIMRDGTGSGIGLYYGYGKQEIEKAAETAAKSDVAILVCGDDNQTSGECNDMSSIRMYGYQHELIKAVCEANNKTVLVLESGKPFELKYEVENVPAIVQGWFGGEFGAKAIVDVLFGKLNPSGKTAITFPKSTGQIPTFYSRFPGSDEHYADDGCVPPFSFGHGLSYTQFEYSGLEIEEAADGSYNVSFKIKNVGKRKGAETAQLYLKWNSASVVMPRILLKEFSRVELESGEEKVVSLKLNRNAFAVYDDHERFTVESGRVTVCIAASSQDIRLRKDVTL